MLIVKIIILPFALPFLVLFDIIRMNMWLYTNWKMNRTIKKILREWQEGLDETEHRKR